MNKKVLIVHGWGGNSKEPIVDFMNQEFSKKGYKVITPDMPETNDPKPELWLNKIKKELGEIKDNTYLVGHSIGGIAILRFIESLSDKEKIRGIILIAPWMGLDKESINEVGEFEAREISNRWFSKKIDWEKIKAKIGKIICIYSKDDPFVPLEGKELFIKKLRAKILIENDKGHFTEPEEVENNVSLKKAVEEIIKI